MELYGSGVVVTVEAAGTESIHIIVRDSGLVSAHYSYLGQFVQPVSYCMAATTTNIIHSGRFFSLSRIR